MHFVNTPPLAIIAPDMQPGPWASPLAPPSISIPIPQPPNPPTLLIDTVIIDATSITICYICPDKLLPTNDAARFMNAGEAIGHYIPLDTKIVHLSSGSHDSSPDEATITGLPDSHPDGPLVLADCIGRRVRIYRTRRPGDEEWRYDRLTVVLIGGVDPRSWRRAVATAKEQVEAAQLERTAVPRSPELSRWLAGEGADDAAPHWPRQGLQQTPPPSLGRTSRFAAALVDRGLGCTGLNSAAIRDGAENTLVHWIAEEVAAWEAAGKAAQWDWVGLAAVTRGLSSADGEVRLRCERVMRRVERGW